jgi:hypothetical protein
MTLARRTGLRMCDTRSHVASEFAGLEADVLMSAA